MHSFFPKFLSRSIVLSVALACYLATVSSVVAEENELPKDAQPIQWRLIWLTDPSTSATLSWSTTVEGKSHRVHLHEADGSGEKVIDAQRNGKYSGKQIDLYYHHAQLTELKPATEYHVTIESDGLKTSEMFFLTAPKEDVPISILFGADSRSGLAERKQMNAMLSSMVAESYQGDRTPILAFAHGGDYIRDGGRLDQWSLWMSDHEITTGPDGRLLPIIPARGNHDLGELFNEVFAFEAKERTNYYSLNLGPQIRLITLNTETSIAGDQTQWLESELKKARPENRWLLAQYHKPAFPAVKPPWINLTHWVPLFEKYNVDMVCEGDGHNIKRTPPIRNFKIDPTGVVYIGEGGLGVGQRTPKIDRWYLRPPHAKTGSEHHVQLLTLDEAKLTYRVILLGGKLFDEHDLPVRPADQRQAK